MLATIRESDSAKNLKRADKLLEKCVYQINYLAFAVACAMAIYMVDDEVCAYPGRYLLLTILILFQEN